MSRQRLKAVFLDTSFLVTLTDVGRDNHDVAVQYYSHWYENGTKMFVSAICYAEYLSKADCLPAYILNSVEVVPFNAEAAAVVGSFMRKRDRANAPTGARDALKDDVKILASAVSYGVSAIAHCDGNSMSKFIAQSRELLPDASNLMSILMADGFNIGAAKLGEPELPL